MKYTIFLLLAVVILSGSACRQNRYSVNINDIELDLSITRLEKELFECDPADLEGRLKELKTRHSEFLRIFAYVINIGDVSDSNWNSAMLSFVTDRQNVEVYDSLKTVFSDFADIESDILNAWKHYKYYFPEKSTPDIYTCLSGFNNSIIVGDNSIGISLDRYLGADSRYYPLLGIYNYLSKNMIPEKVVSDCMYGWAASSWELENNDDRSINLLESMLHKGRLLYFTKLMIPEIADSLLFGYTELQMNFCNNNESQMWEYLVEHDLLFSTDPMVIMKSTEEAPFTTYFTSESPGRSANWIGFRIIDSYMMKNPDISLNTLMNEKNLRSILELSKYSP